MAKSRKSRRSRDKLAERKANEEKYPIYFLVKFVPCLSVNVHVMTFSI